MISANHQLASIKANMLLLWLTLVSTNQVPSKMGQVVKNWGAMYLTILVSHWNSFSFTDEAMVFFFCYQGIEWTAIDYFNNAIICDLVEKVSSDNK